MLRPAALRFGMLDRRQSVPLAENLRALRGKLTSPPGSRWSGSEPACASVFRDEMCTLFPQRFATRSACAAEFLFSEFLNPACPSGAAGQAVSKSRCPRPLSSQSADGLERREAAPADARPRRRPLDSGCCGMAGAFGFEREKYEISRVIGERVLLPAVRQAETNTLVVSGRLHCPGEIAQLTGRRAFHLAEVLQLASNQSRS